MKTIEIKPLTNKTKLIKTLYKKFLYKDTKFHYLFEPQLIIRTNKSKLITDYLKLKKIDYTTYPYPYAKRGFGESKHNNYLQKESEKLYHLQSVFVLKSKKKDVGYFLNRIHHCFLNMMNYDFYDESKYYLDQAKGYMKHQSRTDRKTTTWLAYQIIRGVDKLI
jgi:hypothetical protein